MKWKLKLRQILITSGKITWRFLSKVLYPALMKCWEYLKTVIFPACLKAWRILCKKIFPAFLLYIQTKVFPVARDLYQHFFKRKTVMVSALVVLIILIMVVKLIPDSSDQENPLADPVWSDGREGKLVKRLLTGSWDEQQDVAKEVIENAGISVYDGEALPKDDEQLFVIAPELTLLTNDAIQKASISRLTLTELANLLYEMGFPFAEGKDPSELLQSGISNWVKAALQDPDQPGASTPLFLHAMALQQKIPLDLSSEGWLPSDYKMTYLEIHIFLAAFLQALPDEKQTSRFLDLFGTEVYAAETEGACTYAKNWFNKLGEGNDVGGLTKFNVELVNMIASELTGMGIDALGAVMKNAMVAVSASMKVVKLGMLYWSLEISMTSTPDEVHKPSRSEQGKEVQYTAIVGVNEAQYKQYLEQWNSSPLARNIKDCFSFFGLPMPTDSGDIAADIENWDVEWDLFGSHATFALDKNDFEFRGQLQKPIKRTGPTQGESTFIADLNTENVKDHQGEEVSGKIAARASLETDTPPLIGPYLSAGKFAAEGKTDDFGFFDILGLADAILDVAAGWFQQIVDPEIYHYTAVTYHKFKYPDYSYEGTIQASTQFSEQGEGIYSLGFQDKIPSQYSQSSTITSKATLETLDLKSGFRNDDVGWELVGDGMLSYSYRRSSTASGTTDCINGTVDRLVRSSGSGADTKSYQAEIDLVRTGTEEDGYTFSINANRASAEIDFENKIYFKFEPSGCSFVDSTNKVEKYQNKWQFEIAELREEFTSTEAYQETIQGSSTSKTINGLTTRWTWLFKRVDISDDPTYTPPPMGG